MMRTKIVMITLRFKQTTLLIGLLLCLIVGSPFHSNADAATPTPTPTSSSAPVVMTFTQSNHSPGNVTDQLTFTVHSDDTTTLTTVMNTHEDSIQLWQQPGTVTTDQ